MPGVKNFFKNPYTYAVGVPLGTGLAGLGIVNAKMNDIRDIQAQQGYVGRDNAPMYVQDTYNIDPADPSAIQSLPPELFKQLILDPKHGGMWNPVLNEMQF